MPQDAVLNTDAGYHDFSLDDTGQIVVEDFWDTAILYSIFGEKRADDSEMPVPERQRGWIGNENTDFENGSKIWLYYQARVNNTTINGLQNEAANALQWLVDDGIAVSIDAPIITASGTSVSLEITIRRSNSSVINRSFVLWNNTGVQ